MRIYTIGFTQKPAERFFGLLHEHGVRRLLDTRLHPDGQLAGFAKRTDLAYFLRELADCAYAHVPALAPTDEILSGYRADKDWPGYVRRFEALMDERGIPGSLDRALFDRPAVMLCSEHKPDKCHRRLVAERLERLWPEASVIHLV